VQGTGDKNMENYKTKVLELIENAKRGTLDRNDLMKKLNIRILEIYAQVQLDNLIVV
jgi:hypothetical protein